MTDEFVDGQWHALDAVLSALNSVDTEGKTADEAKRDLYGSVMKVRPAPRASREGFLPKENCGLKNAISSNT